MAIGTPPSTPKHPRKISDRKIHIVTAGPVIDAPPGSDCSQEPASPSRTDQLPAPPSIPKFHRKSHKYLKRQHPSLEVISKRIRNCADQDSLRSLVVVFNHVVQLNILPSIAELPFVDKSDDEFRARHFIVEDTCHLLLEQASKVASKRASGDFTAVLDKTLILVDLTIEALHELVHVAEQLFFAGKPLPEIPAVTEDTAASLVDDTSSALELPEQQTHEARRSLTVIVEEVLSEAAPDSPMSISFSIIEHPADADKKVHFLDPRAQPAVQKAPANVRPTTRLGITQRLHQLQQVVQRSKSSLTLRSISSRLSRSGSHLTLELEDDTKSFQHSVSIKSIKVPYSYRQSLIFSFLEGEARPEMPMPVLDDVFVNQDGKVVQTTFDALFLQVTSNIVLEQPDLIPFFFRCFRYCASPERLAGMLEARFLERPPDRLDAAQLRVWVRSNEGTKHRVRNLLHIWLYAFWEPTLDDAAVAPLLQFALAHLHTLNDASTVHVFNLVISAGKGHKSRLGYLRRVQEKVARSALVLEPEPTRFMLTSLIGEIQMFMNPRGRVEIARQFTVRCSALFQRLDGTGLVRSWFRGSTLAPELQLVLDGLSEWSRRLSMLVTKTILNVEATEGIVKVFEFWLEVMMECLHQHNFHDAMAIFTGLDCSAARRPKLAIFSVDLSHKTMYHMGYKLFFSDYNMKEYRHVVQGVRDKVLPHTLLIDTLNKDVSGAKAVRDSAEVNKNSAVINFMPYHVLNATIESIEAAQFPHKFATLLPIQQWLDNETAIFVERGAEEALYQQSLSRFPRASDAFSTISDPWQFSLNAETSKHEPVPVVRLRTDLDKMFLIHEYDADVEGSRARRATLALLKASGR